MGGGITPRPPPAPPPPGPPPRGAGGRPPPPPPETRADRQPGFKASGGVRTVADAALYAALVRELLGADALNPRRFRIGASGLLDDIDAVLAGRSASVTAPSSAGPPPVY